MDCKIIAMTNYDEKFVVHVEFEVVSTVIKRIPEVNSLSILCMAKLNFKHSKHIIPESIFVMEEEVTGYATGDFVGQCVSAIDPSRADLNHNPLPIPHDITKEKQDMIGKDFYLDKPYKNGTVEWDIPVIFQDKDDNEIQRIIVKQKFILENGKLTIQKGGKTLVRDQDLTLTED